MEKTSRKLEERTKILNTKINIFNKEKIPQQYFHARKVMLYTNIRLDWKTIEYFRNINIKKEEKQALENSSISKVRPNHS